MPITDAAAELERAVSTGAEAAEVGRWVAEVAGLCDRAQARPS
jgi:hypothetical protein